MSLRKQVLYLIFTKTISGEETSMLLKSVPPFEEWSSYELPSSLNDMVLVGVSWDIQRSVVILLLTELREVCRVSFAFILPIP